MIAIMSASDSLFDGAPVRALTGGEHLFRRDEPVRSMFLIREGEVALERSVISGATLTLHVARAGALIAEASLFAQAYHCDGIARGAARVAVASKADVLAALGARADAALDLLARSAREVQAQRTRIEILRLRRVADRLDAWLDIHGEPARGEWIKVAEAIGVTPPALYRELAKRR